MVCDSFISNNEQIYLVSREGKEAGPNLVKKWNGEMSH